MKLGRKPRIWNPAVPHWSALKMARAPIKVPAATDYTAGLPADLGMMLNDTLGDCTCAAIYHARQVWSNAAQGAIDTQPDAEVEAAYEQFCGYVPGDPSTDRGGNEQSVLTDWVKLGAPLAGGVDKLARFIEVDPTNAGDVDRAIYECGGVYIGLNVPAFLMAGTPPAIWDVDPAGDNSIVGGHAVFVAGYSLGGVKLISWGSVYEMTWAFWRQFVEESYALADNEWIKAKGLTPLGLSLAQLEAQMQAL
jgi:hypothetical protein